MRGHRWFRRSHGREAGPLKNLPSSDRFTRLFSDRLRNSDDLHAELVGTLGQLVRHPFAVSVLVAGLALVDVLLVLGQHRVDEPGELVRGIGHRLGLVHRSAHPAEVGPRRRLAGAQRRSRQPQGLRSMSVAFQ
jgi:hypothetical protein